MRKHVFGAVAAIVLGGGVAWGQAPPADGQPEMIVENEIVVQLDSIGLRLMETGGVPDQGVTFVPGLDEIGARFGVSALRPQFPGSSIDDAVLGLPDLSGYHVVTFDPARGTAKELVEVYQAQPFVLSAEVIGIHRLDAVPNDGNYPSQWHLNQGNDSDIDAPEAWDDETGDPSVVVAVLDSGVRYYHKDLGGGSASSSNPAATDGNIWINLAEKNGSAGVDDDGNGYVDDWVGYDFVNGATQCWAGEDCNGTDNDPRDFNGHGTHCAGNVGAINNNGYATASPAGGWGNGSLQASANGVKVMCLRMGWSGSYFGQEVGYVRMDFAASAFYYAANNGANIASCSWGSSNSGGIGAAVDYFVGSGGLVFVAAGNAGNQSADYLNGRSDCYSVAATDQSDVKASFSSYGTWVDISAPGVGILSSYHVHSDPGGDYVATLDGTSMATPLVASTAAAVWSANPSWSAAQVWAQVRDTVDPIDSLNPAYAGLLGSGRINLAAAVAGGGTGGCTGDAECDDGDPCNGTEQCVGGVCQPGSLTADCNGNGNEDSCDISSGSSDDCNGNGVPDECDISSGSSDDCNGNGVPDECETDPCGGGGGGSTLLMSFRSNTAVPGVGTVRDEDIVAFDTDAGTWSLYFDGSDVGLGSLEISGLAVLADGDLIMSFTAAGTVGGIAADDSDIMRFTPSSLGSSTSGSWSMFFDGSDVGMSSNGEDIDAIAFAPDGRLVVSTLGSAGVSGLSGIRDEDLIVFNDSSLGTSTSGTFSMYFDGSDVGLSNSGGEDVDAASILSPDRILLSTVGSFSVSGLSGPDEDVFDFSPSSLGTSTSGSFSAFFDATANGILSGEDVGSVEEIE